MIVQALGHVSYRHRTPFVVAAPLLSSEHLGQETSRVKPGLPPTTVMSQDFVTAHILCGSPERPLTPKDSKCMTVHSVPVFTSNCLTS